MGCRLSCCGFLAEFVEEVLEFVGSRNNDSNTQHVQIKEQTKCCEVTVEERVFVIPLSFDRYAISIVVYVMCRGERLAAISEDFNVKALFFPALFIKKIIKTFCDRGFITSLGLDF